MARLADDELRRLYQATSTFLEQSAKALGTDGTVTFVDSLVDLVTSEAWVEVWAWEDGSLEEHLTTSPIGQKSEARERFAAQLVERALVEPLAYDTVTKAAAWLLEQEDAVLPLAFRDWTARVLRGEQRRPRQRGPSKERNRARNQVIAEAVERLRAEGLRATRSQGSTNVSACDFVSEALIASFRIPVGYDAVREIWRGRSR